MPKTFTQEERNYIKKRLLQEGRVCLAQYGIRKTTVDELVKRVNIPKGTFYLFYPSKEMLFYEVLCDIHNELHNILFAQIEKLDGEKNIDTITELLYGLYKKLNPEFLYMLIDNGEIELLMRKLPAEIVLQHTQHDDFSVEKFIAMLPIKYNERKIKIFSAVLRAIFCSILHKREIGEAIFDDTIRAMLKGALIVLFEGEGI